MGSKSSNAAPPDPRLIEGQLKSMGIQDAMIQQIIQNTEDTAPLQKESLQFGLDTSRTGYDQSQEDRSWMLGRRGELSTLQDTQVNDAATFNTEDKANELAGKASADVNVAFANAEGQNGRAMARMGVNPNSGKALAVGNQTAIAKAAALAGAATGARTSARAEGRALTDRATNTLAGYPSMATTATGAGVGFGANGITVANTGLAGLNSGNLSAAQVAGQMGSNAANMYGTMGNYKNQADQVAASSDPFASILGAGAQLGAAWLGKSDRRLKRDIIAVGMHEPTGLSLYEFAYHEDPVRRYRGVMADEVLEVMPTAVIEDADGFLRVNYTALGIEMLEIQGVAA